MKKLILVISVLLTLTTSLSFGDVPQLINYQGELTDTNGAPLSGSHALTFNIYNAATGGTHLWGPQVFSSVAFTDGHFNVILGDANIASAFSGAAAYLQISVDGEDISPRQQILSAPYAVSAQTSASVNSNSITTANLVNNAVDTTKLADNCVTNDKINHNSYSSSVINWTGSSPTDSYSTTLLSIEVAGTNPKVGFYNSSGEFAGFTGVTVSNGSNTQVMNISGGGVILFHPGINTVTLTSAGYSIYPSTEIVGKVVNYQMIFNVLF